MNIKIIFEDFNTKQFNNFDSKAFATYKTYVKGLSKTGVDDGILDLDKKIKEAPSSNKEKILSIHKAFVSFIIDNYAPDAKSNLMQARAYSTPRRRIELIKFLQEAKSDENIENEFAISGRTLGNDWKTLAKGIEFGGHILKVERHTYGDRYTIDAEGSKCSLNPIAVTYNMTELYFLTNIIPEALEKCNPELTTTYKYIIQKMYPELTNNAKSLMHIECESLDKQVLESEHDFVKKDVIRQLSYLSKLGASCKILYDDNGVQVFNADSVYWDHQNGSIIARGKEEIEIKVSDIKEIVDYKYI